jgi:hypothetical protein
MRTVWAGRSCEGATGQCGESAKIIHEIRRGYRGIYARLQGSPPPDSALIDNEPHDRYFLKYQRLPFNP